MRYYKQLHKSKYIYLIVLGLGAVCLYLAFFDSGLDSSIIFLSSGLVCLMSG